MCGIIGHISCGAPVDGPLFTAMRDTLAHRGPDDAGNYFTDDLKVALGHRRLSFFDLGPNGHQPMPYADGRYWITYNGEVYNFRELREELMGLGHAFRTDTDTEVIMAGYQAWGKQVFSKLKGMFALGIWDAEKKLMVLARDRFGIKPLYYWHSGSHFIFASELKGIMRSPLVPRQLDVSSFADYFVYRYIPSPKTIWQGVHKLQPAHWLELDTLTLNFTLEEYWKPAFAEVDAPAEVITAEVDEALLRSIDMHRRADVPVGSFLSGGYDSSALVYYLSRVGYKPSTFSIGFDNWERSEHQYAQMVARQYGVPNRSVIATEADLELLDLMPEVYDEPIADISIIPTYMVSSLARKEVKAVLSGEGADELFCGYAWQSEYYAQKHPKGLKGRLKGLFQKEDMVGFYANAMAMGRFDAAELRAMLPDGHHRHIAANVDWFYAKHAEGLSPTLKSIQWMDTKCFMAELVLTKVDRASMARSLEVRVPFLDHELFELIFSTAEHSYYRPDTTKLLLNRNLQGHLPESILQRKKQGFVGPDSYYMNIEWYQARLADSSLVKAGLVNQSYIDNLLQNKDHWRLWKLLVMDNWYKHWLG